MDNNENLQKKPINYFLAIIITQCICVFIILSTVLCIKYFFKDTYNHLKAFYIQELCSVTDINEVINPEVIK